MKTAYDYYLEAQNKNEFYSQKSIEWNLSIPELKSLLNLQCINIREISYPDHRVFLDAWVKNDLDALEEYKQLCLSVKAQYPKPE